MRVPEALSEAKEVRENADTEKMKSTFSQWLVVVFSKKVFAREPKTLEKRIKKENREGNAEKGEVHRRYKRVRQRETE